MDRSAHAAMAGKLGPSASSARWLLAVTVAGALAACGSCPPASEHSVPVNTRDLTEVVDANTAEGGPQPAPVIQFRELTDATVDPTIPEVPRQFRMGVVPIGAPGPGFTHDDIVAAVQRASQIAECVVIRPLIDWEYFRPGGSGDPERLSELVEIADLARAWGMPYSLIELDPLLTRHSVSPLPAALEGQDFSSPDVQAALRGMVHSVAERVHPTYLSFGVEINGYYEANPTDFARFVELHKGLYDEVKAISPDTRIAVAFNYEAMQGLLRGLDEYSADGPRFFLIDMFEPKVDAVAFSTLPWPLFASPLYIPDDYISSLQKHTTRPILLSETGWTTADIVGSNETEQLQYVAIMARQVLRTPQVELMAWSISTDPPPGTVFDEFPTFLNLGLFRQDGQSKPAVSLWLDLLSRPYEPQTP